MRIMALLELDLNDVNRHGAQVEVVGPPGHDHCRWVARRGALCTLAWRPTYGVSYAGSASCSDQCTVVAAAL